MEVFKKNLPQLLKAVNIDAQSLATAFFADGIIGDDILEEIYSSTSKNQRDQTLKLLHSVLKIIKAHPERFDEVCTALEQDYASIAKRLKGMSGS